MSTSNTATVDVDDFTATYLLGSARHDSIDRTLGGERELGERAFSTESRNSLDFGDSVREADEFMKLNNNNNNDIERKSSEIADAVMMENKMIVEGDENQNNKNNSEEKYIESSNSDYLEHEEKHNEGSDTFSSDLNENRTDIKVQRNSSLNHMNVIREKLIQSSSLSRSTNDLRSANFYRPSSLSSNLKNQQHNRFSYHDDINLHHNSMPLSAGNQRDIAKQSHTTIERSNLNSLQEKYSQAIQDFKILRSTLTENMERNLLRTEHFEQQLQNNGAQSKRNVNNNNIQYKSQENIYRNSSYNETSSTSSSSRGLGIQGQQQPIGTSDVVYRNKTNNNTTSGVDQRYSSQERLFKRFSDMNLEEKFGSANYVQQQQQQHQQQPQQNNSPRSNNRHTIAGTVGTNNNYDMKAYSSYGGKPPPPSHEFQYNNEQHREYQSQLRDQAAKSNFERYLKGSFNSHNSFDHTNHMEDPGYGGSGSTSPREMDTIMITDRLSSRSGSIASRQSQSSAVASVDSGVRMSYVGQHNSLVVVAIDFGTTFSGYAFSFTRDANSIHMMRRWEGGDPGVTNQKTPTTLLLKPDGTFHSFGFGARDFYHDLDANDAKKWMYFDKFKMKLHASEDLNSGVEIKAANGKTFPALKVFSHALRFFKKHVLDELSDQSTAKLSEEDITWVVTVPAIWRQPAKQFMRTAAYEAGIASLNHPDRLLIALEPEAASIFCRKLRIRDCVIEDDLKAKAGDDSLISEEFEGITQYIVVDCGGGTVDLTVHELDVTQGTLKELHKGTGGPSGATGVDREFEKLLKRMFDADFIERFKVKRPAAWIDLMISFEAKKRTARPDNQSPLNISLPFSFIEYHKKHRKMTVENAIKKYKSPDIKWSSQGMLRFSANVIQTLFEPVMNEIIGHIQNLLMKPSLKHVEHLFLVGGFAESPLLQSTIRESLDGRVRVIIPNDVGLAILKGAVLFGLDPTIVRVRRSAYTYGVGVLNKFDTDKHDQSKRVIKDGVVWCKDIFDCFVRVDESIGNGDRVTRSYAPARSKQKSTVINVYCTEKLDVLYTTDKGVTKCGKLRIEMPDVNPEDIPPEKRGKPRELQASMIFGDTEIKVSAVDVLSGKAARANIDFLNY